MLINDQDGQFYATCFLTTIKSKSRCKQFISLNVPVSSLQSVPPQPLTAVSFFLSLQFCFFQSVMERSRAGYDPLILASSTQPHAFEILPCSSMLLRVLGECSFSLLRSIPRCARTTVYLIVSPVGGHVGCFHFLATEDKNHYEYSRPFTSLCDMCSHFS